MKNKTLYILTYDHGGYVLWGEKLRTQFASAIDWLEKYPGYKTGLDFEAFTFDELERIDPEFNKLVAETLEKYPDRFGLGSTTYGQPLSLYISEESNVRQLTYAIKTNLRHFGTTPSVYAISEFALNNQSPQMLKLCNYEAAIFRTHVMNYGYQKSFNLPWGLWVGRDGTGIPSVPSVEGQGSGYFDTTLDNWVLTRWPGWTDRPLEEFEETFKNYEPLLATRYDDLTLRFEGLVAHAEEKGNCKFILLEEIPALFGAAKELMETRDTDFHGRMPWGYCGNEIFNGVRAGENAAAVAEKFNAVSVMLGGSSAQADLEAAWSNILVAQHHDVTICGLLDDARRFIPASLEAAAKANARTVSDLAPRFASEKDGLLVFNPAGFEVCAWVETAANGNKSAFIGETELKTETVGDTLRILANVPGLTAQRIDLSPAEPGLAPSDFSYSDGVLNTPLYQIELSDFGIVSILDKRTGAEIADNGEGKLFAAWIDGEDCVSKGAWEVRINPHSACATSKGEIGGVPYRFTMNLSELAPIECSAAFDISGQHIGRTGVTKGLRSAETVNGFVHENKLRFCLDLKLDTDRRMVRDLPFSISDWDGQLQKVQDSWYEPGHVLADQKVSSEESFANTTYLEGVYWVALRDSIHGMAFINRGCMGSSVLGNSVSIPLIYSNEYIQNTRILNGTFENSFALLPLGDISDADIHRTALACQQPLISAEIRPGCGDLESFSAADICTRGEVILTALCPEDGAIFARFCNYSDSKATLDFAPTVGRVTAEVNLLGQELSPATGKAMAFRPWEIKTLKIEL